MVPSVAILAQDPAETHSPGMSGKGRGKGGGKGWEASRPPAPPQVPPGTPLPVVGQSLELIAVHHNQALRSQEVTTTTAKTRIGSTKYLTPNGL
jgi:hypothetical protein